MLSEEDEWNLIKKIFKSTGECNYIKINGDHIISIKPSKKIEITIVNDFVIEEIERIDIVFENDDDIDELIINIKSGANHDSGEIIGYDSDHDDFGHNRFTLQSNNKINNLIVSQKLKTEHIYSYYGNQDGFLASTISIRYDTNKYKKFKFKGDLEVSSKYQNDYDSDYDLEISM